MEKLLLNEYKEIFKSKNNKPNWAVHKVAEGHQDELVHCSIPFVGKQYVGQKIKILVYASAENLSGYEGHLDCDEYAINRHRNCFEKTKDSEVTFFPNVHIRPMEDGCLAIVALYTLLKLQEVGDIKPADFFEMIAFANYGKYTVSSKTNEDYAGIADMLKESHNYIRKDVGLLQPNYIIMPKTIYQTDCKFIEEIKGNAVILPIYQINAGNINRWIKKYVIARNEARKEESDLPDLVRKWYHEISRTGLSGISGKTYENFLYVFNYMDDVIQNYTL